MRPALVSALLSCAVVLAACGDTTTDPAPTPTIDFAAEARRLVGSAVFSADDLPGLGPPGADDLQLQAGLSDECDVFDPVVVFPDAVSTADSGAYAGAFDDQFVNLAGIYRTAEDASAALARTRDLRDRCEDEFKDTAEQAARDFLDALGIELGFFSTIEVAITDYDPTPVSDEVVGFRMYVNVNLVLASEQYNLHAIVAREGRVAGALLYGRFGQLNDNVEEELLAGC